MKGFIEKLLKFEGAAVVLAAILLGRVIGQVARGFPDDPETRAQASLYLAIAKLFPHNPTTKTGVVTVPILFNSMVARAPDNGALVDDLNLTDEEKAEWLAGSGASERDKLKASIRPLMDMLKAEAESATIKVWYDLTPLAQYSLAVRIERNLWQAVLRYSSWTSPEGVHLRETSQAAVDPTSNLVSELTAAYKDELDQARSQGINIASRVERQAA